MKRPQLNNDALDSLRIGLIQAVAADVKARKLHAKDVFKPWLLEQLDNQQSVLEQATNEQTTNDPVL